MKLSKCVDPICQMNTSAKRHSPEDRSFSAGAHCGVFPDLAAKPESVSASPDPSRGPSGPQRHRRDAEAGFDAQHISITQAERKCR